MCPILFFCNKKALAGLFTTLERMMRIELT